jgi:cation:H+ antiporter
VRQGKTDLALANISGSMMIQATVPSGLGILFTSWHFDAPLMTAGVVTAAAIVYLLITIRSRRLTPIRLAGAIGFYALFTGTLAVL